MKTIIKILILILFAANAYSDSITGIIVDEKKNPLPGANVFIKGSVLGSASNKDGFFQIKNVPS